MDNDNNNNNNNNNDKENTESSHRNVRFPTYETVVQKGLERSRKAVPVRQLVDQAWGDNATVLGRDLLVGTLEDLMENVQEGVLADWKQQVQERNVQETLHRVESLMHQLEMEQQRQEMEEKQDEKTTQEALESTLLPKNVTLEDVYLYVRYQQSQEQKRALEEALQQVEDELGPLQEKLALETAREEEQLTKTLEPIAKQWTECAHQCSMVAP
eukprot:Nitzschia sp. Nitz4//scaffold168_size48592//35334//35975//NITZ4_007054-RA/size48592-processed-gene-0.40-mRNA-1//-1//CDS//3329538333//685//frame0